MVGMAVGAKDQEVNGLDGFVGGDESQKGTNKSPLSFVDVVGVDKVKRW